MLNLEVHVVALPMHVPFRGVTVREALLLGGPAGWGEFSPFVEYDDVESSRWLASAVESATVSWPAPVRDQVPVNATVPAVLAAQVEAVLARFPGCTTAKVKVGDDLAADVNRVAAVRAALGPRGRIRVDANAAWSLEQALDALTALAPFDLEYAEQPCASLEELAALRVLLARSGVEVLVAADESIRKAEDPLRVAVAGAADVVVLKVAPLGGVAKALEVAEACGLPVVVSSALDTSVGISAGVALAAALPSLPFACGLATTSLMAADVVADSLDGHGGFLLPGRVAPTAELLVRHAAPEDRQEWWRARLERCAEVLGSQA